MSHHTPKVPSIKPAVLAKKPKHPKINLSNMEDLDDLQELMELELMKQQDTHRRVRKLHYELL